MKEKQKHIKAYEMWFELLIKGYNPTQAVNYVSEKFNTGKRSVWRWYSSFDWQNRAENRLNQINKTSESIKNSKYIQTKDEIDLLLNIYEEFYDLKHQVKNIAKPTVFRDSPEYRRYVKQVIKRDSHCQCCGSFEKLEVHHPLPFNLYNYLGDDINNGIVLCEQCHDEYHHIYGWREKCNPITLIKFIKNNQNNVKQVQTNLKTILQSH